jgi:excisionase family DNA binding protein
MLTIRDDLPKKPLTPKELASWLGVSRRFLEGQVRNGNLRARRISLRAVRFLPSDVAAWLQKVSSLDEDS